MNEKAKDIVRYLNEILPDAHCELHYRKDYELVIAVMLSAQTSDKAVNNVTDKLFSKYTSLQSLAEGKYEDLVKYTHELGLYQRKTLNIIAIAQILNNDYRGIVPKEKEQLMKLPGVGNKTANVVRAELFKIPEFPVDTHINRISKRLKIAKKDDTVMIVEEKLRKMFPVDKYILLHHQLIHFGREICRAQNPNCEQCKLKKYCNYSK